MEVTITTMINDLGPGAYKVPCKGIARGTSN